MVIHLDESGQLPDHVFLDFQKTYQEQLPDISFGRKTVPSFIRRLKEIIREYESIEKELENA
jgi:hypothetical protein